jgi:hypothetical protein
MISKLHASIAPGSVYVEDFSFENSLDKFITNDNSLDKLITNEVTEKKTEKSAYVIESENKAPITSTSSTPTNSSPAIKESLAISDDKSFFYYLLKKDIINDVCDIKKKGKRDRNKLIMKLLPKLWFSLFTFIYMMTLIFVYFPKVFSKQIDQGRYGFILNVIFLVILPFETIILKKNIHHCLSYITGVISISCELIYIYLFIFLSKLSIYQSFSFFLGILNLKSILQDETSHSLVSYFMSVIIYRIFFNSTIYDNFAFVAVYIGDLNMHKEEFSFHSSVLYMIGCLIVALLFRRINTKITHRINEHVLVHIILKEKNKQELLTAQTLISVRFITFFLTISIYQSN